jgi:hypothetical protein
MHAAGSWNSGLTGVGRGRAEPSFAASWTQADGKRLASQLCGLIPCNLDPRPGSGSLTA